MQIDEKLWAQCQGIVNFGIDSLRDDECPYFLGMAEGRKVWLVDGDYVKINFEMNFCEGGNHMRYPKFIPRGCVWLDNNVKAHDHPPNCYHETMEYRLMEMGMSYDDAHDICNEHEKILRLRLWIPYSIPTTEGMGY